jgi:hypothetical protein
LPTGDSVLAQAIVELYLYSGIRPAAGCHLAVEDFRQDGEEATLRLHEKATSTRPSVCTMPPRKPFRNTFIGPSSAAGRSSGRCYIRTLKDWERRR